MSTFKCSFVLFFWGGGIQYITDKLWSSHLCTHSYLLNEEWLLEMTNHNRKDDGRHGGLEDPEKRQTEQLDKCEEMDLSQWDVPQVDQVWLVFGRHQEQFEPVHKLRTKEQYCLQEILILTKARFIM